MARRGTGDGGRGGFGGREKNEDFCRGWLNVGW